MAAARSTDHVIKLLAIAERTVDGRGISVRVHPAMVPRNHPLASVRDAYNAVFVETDAAGQLMFYGRGAGGVPTASAVVGDVVAVARNRISGGHGPRESVYAGLPVVPMGRVVHPLLHRDRRRRQGRCAGPAWPWSSPRHDVSIETLRQDGHGDDATLQVVTHEAREADLAATVETLRGLDVVRDVAAVVRVVGA